MPEYHDLPDRLPPSAAEALQELLNQARPAIQINPGGVARFTITLDPDIVLACQDRAQAFNMTLEEWVQQAAAEGLRMQLGI
jgi:hypothetical protein